ncbi:MAG TPA: hypothetical protein VND64_14175 [Pirellulales bacterium]|nr:hypothetical protein [Pirellulales bacterium]
MCTLILGTGLLGTGGCGQKLPVNPKTYLVRGKVTAPGGAPARGGAVHFSSAKSESYDGSGKILPDGTYSAGTFPGQKGLVPGDYKVWVEPHNPGVHGQIEGAPTPVPDKYQKAETSGLTFTVEAKENTYDIELK